MHDTVKYFAGKTHNNRRFEPPQLSDLGDALVPRSLQDVPEPLQVDVPCHVRSRLAVLDGVPKVVCVSGPLWLILIPLNAFKI